MAFLIATIGLLKQITREEFDWRDYWASIVSPVLLAGCCWGVVLTIRSVNAMHKEDQLAWREWKETIIGQPKPAEPSGSWRIAALVPCMIFIAIGFLATRASFASRTISTSVQCSLTENSSPCEMQCHIVNAGPDAVRDVAIGFNGFLLWKTALKARPNHRIRLERVESLPTPAPSGEFDGALKAYTIVVPLVPPMSKSTLPSRLPMTTTKELAIK